MEKSRPGSNRAFRIMFSRVNASPPSTLGHYWWAICVEENPATGRAAGLSIGEDRTRRGAMAAAMARKPAAFGCR